MPTVDPYPSPHEPAPPPIPKTSSERANDEAGKLLKHFNSAKPIPNGFVPGVGMPDGSDIPKPHGLYTNSIFAPGVWPSDSENELKQKAKEFGAYAQRHDNAADTVQNLTRELFSTSWTSGEGFEAAYDHYGTVIRGHQRLANVGEKGSAALGRLGEDVSRIKRLMREAHDTAHQQIEAYLKSPGGRPTATIEGFLSTARASITAYSTELTARDKAETTLLSNEFGVPETPQPIKPASNEGASRDSPTSGPSDGNPEDDPRNPHRHPGDGLGTHYDKVPTGSDVPHPGDALPGHDGGARRDLSGPASRPGGMPALPSLPSSGGGGSSPLSSLGGGGGGPLQGLLGGKGLTGPLSNATPAALQSPAGGAAPPSLASEFGRGLASGANAAGSMPPPAPPQAPAAPLAAPISQAGGSAPVSAAPAAGATQAASSPVGGGAGAPTVSGGAGASGAMPPMSSYGSVLPPSAMPASTAGAGAGGIGGAPPPPTVTSGAGSPAPATGLMPVRDHSGPQRVGRDVSLTDLELARVAVADLAAASAVVYPGLEWAVVVSRGPSGVPELWVTTNEGAGYIPAGVYLRRSMPLAARFDADFDARWFGWFNPAETALRAVRSRGDTVSAIATTWSQRSDLVDDATPDAAIGVPPSSAPTDAEASQLLKSRSHRLETVAPGVYQSLVQADQHVAETYARQLTQEATFRGNELSSVAQSIGRALIGSRWPSDEQWAALRSEYEMERLMAGSQRPGLQGYEQPDQLTGYIKDFVHCRRLETLLCWESGSPADVVYAAAMAGIALNSLVVA